MDRFGDYLPAIAEADVGVDLLVYTPDEFAQMQAEERPFLVDALADAKQIKEARVGTVPPDRRASAGGRLR